LSRLNVRPLAQYLAERVGVTDGEHWKIVLEGGAGELRRTEIAHVHIGNVELEQRAIGVELSRGGPGA
jgi:hypothetical protein